MAKVREICCIHYKAKGECDLGKKAEFYGLCQTCQKYFPKPGSRPARTDNRRRKLEKYRKHDREDY